MSTRNEPKYRAWVRRREDVIAPDKGDFIYQGKPRGNLVGELPLGSWPMPAGQCGTLDRRDGGDPFEHALFTTPNGRVIVVERQT